MYNINYKIKSVHLLVIKVIITTSCSCTSLKQTKHMKQIPLSAATK